MYMVIKLFLSYYIYYILMYKLFDYGIFCTFTSEYYWWRGRGSSRNDITDVDMDTEDAAGNTTNDQIIRETNTEIPTQTLQLNLL